MKAIAPIQPTTTVSVVASEVVALGRAGTTTSTALNLQAGQILRATVLDLPANGQVLLAVGGNSNNRLLAETALPLQRGQTLSLRLLASEPTMQFSVAERYSSMNADAPGQRAATITVIASETAATAFAASETAARGRAAVNAGAPAQTTIAIMPAETTALGRAGAPLNLETGRILHATVLDLPTKGQALLAFSGNNIGGNSDNRLLVASRLPLQTGQTLALRLVASEPRLLFTIVDNAATVPQLLGKSVAVADKAMAVTTLIPLLQQANPPLLPRLSPGSQQILINYLQWQQGRLNGDRGGQILRQLIEHLGLNLERHLAEGRPETAKISLKAALMETVQQFGQTDGGKSAAQAKTQAASMLSAIEMFQLAQTQLATGKELLYPLPLPFLETGYLLVEDDGGHEQDGKDGEMPAKFSLFLSLTELGFLRIDFVSNPEGLALRFHTDSQEKADFTAGFADKLRRAINTASGLSVISLSFAADAQDPVKELLLKMLPDNSNLLKTTA